jgi:DNA polymerase elongation subunit (family B)
VSADRVVFEDGEYICLECNEVITYGGGSIDRQVVEVVNHVIGCVVEKKIARELDKWGLS